MNHVQAERGSVYVNKHDISSEVLKLKIGGIVIDQWVTLADAWITTSNCNLGQLSKGFIIQQVLHHPTFSSCKTMLSSTLLRHSLSENENIARSKQACFILLPNRQHSKMQKTFQQYIYICIYMKYWNPLQGTLYLMCYTVELSVKTDDVSRNFSNKETKFQLTHDSSLVSLPRGRKTLLGENVRNDAILVL